MLRGGLVVTPACLGSGGTTAPALRYLPAVATKRFIWVSDQFKATHGTLYKLLRDCCARRQCLGKFVAEKAAFEHALALDDRRAARCRRPFEYLGLVTLAEKKEDRRLSCVCASSRVHTGSR